MLARNEPKRFFSLPMHSYLDDKIAGKVIDAVIVGLSQ